MGLPTFYDPAGVYAVGDITVLEDGKRYRITRKTQLNMAVERYYWFDALADYLKGKLAKDTDVLAK